MNFDKKGSGSMDLVVTFLFFFFVVFLFIICILIYSGFNDGLQSADSSVVPASVKTMSGEYNTRLRSVADGGAIMVLVILWFGTLVTSLFLDNYPIFFVIFSFLSFFLFFIVLPIANVMHEFIQIPIIQSIATSMPKSVFVIDHSAAFLAAFILTEGIVLYAKFKR